MAVLAVVVELVVQAVTTTAGLAAAGHKEAWRAPTGNSAAYFATIALNVSAVANLTAKGAALHKVQRAAGLAGAAAIFIVAHVLAQLAAE